MIKTARTVLAASFLILAGNAVAAPQGTWPEEARAHPLPVQKWIMVIPAKRLADGGISVWDKADDWTRRWIVPKPTPQGTRTVTVSGDSEDRRIVGSPEIDAMRGAALSKLASKYGATGIAVVVTDDNGDVAVAAWAKGRDATWDTAVKGDDMHKAALSTIDAIYSGAPVSSSQPTDVASTGNTVHIIGQRQDAASGQTEYRITADAATLDAIAASPTFTIKARNGDVPPSVDLLVSDGQDIENALADAGFSAR